MCGICGIVDFRSPKKAGLERSIRSMVGSLKHRGPDGMGFQTFPPSDMGPDVGLGHTRLSIIDLSDAGSQPMSNEDGSVWIVFNGEIYNFKELRGELKNKGHHFTSLTDTEVIVHLYEEYGRDCVGRLNGIFAFAILDCRKQRVILARDHIGIKPLYYSAAGAHFVFGSEIKAILASGYHSANVNWQAVHDYFTYLYIPCPQTVFEGISQVPPAHVLDFDLRKNDFELHKYWQVKDSEYLMEDSLCGLEESTRALLTDCVSRQLMSDVPLGVFLSGGVDSPIVAGLMKETGAEVRTFTVTFEGEEFADYNEQERALAVSDHLGTTHQELPVKIEDPLEMLDLGEFFDQPFGNPTYYLMQLISKRARDHITVALCGAGGDELYAGYPRYRAARLAPLLRLLPRPVTSFGRWCLGRIPDNYRTMHLRRAREFIDGLDSDPVRQFMNWTYHLSEGEKNKLFRESNKEYLPAQRVLEEALEASCLEDKNNRFLHLDVQTFLVDNILQYTDRMSMAVGLEVRVPLLDYRFVEASLNVPFANKLKGGESKRLLKRSFADFFPESVRRGPKKGFNVPLGRWMQESLDKYFEASFQPLHFLKDRWGEDIGSTWHEGLLDVSYIQVLREEHKLGKRDNSYELFGIISFDVWWRKYIKGSLPLVNWDTPES